jgi:hypothetical protein
VPVHGETGHRPIRTFRYTLWPPRGWRLPSGQSRSIGPSTLERVNSMVRYNRFIRLDLRRWREADNDCLLGGPRMDPVDRWSTLGVDPRMRSAEPGTVPRRTV